MSNAIATTLDLRGLSCPLPIAKTALAFRTLPPGEAAEVLATDAGSVADFTAWCQATGNQLLEHTTDAGVYRFVIRRK